MFRCQFPKSRERFSHGGDRDTYSVCGCRLKIWVYMYDHRRPRSFSVYFCPFSGIRPHASPLPQISRSRSNPQGDKAQGLEPEAPVQEGLTQTMLSPGPPPFSEDRWVAITGTNVCEKEGLSDLQSCPSKKGPPKRQCVLRPQRHSSVALGQLVKMWDFLGGKSWPGGL